MLSQGSRIHLAGILVIPAEARRRLVGRELLSGRKGFFELNRRHAEGWSEGKGYQVEGVLETVSDANIMKVWGTREVCRRETIIR